MKALKSKQAGIVYPILSAKDFDGYDYNRPSSKWELVKTPEGDMVWMPNNPEFVEMVTI